MWRRILERLFPRLRPAFKAPEQLAPDYPRFVLAARGANGEFPIIQFSDGTIWVLASTDAQGLAEQGAAMKQVGLIPTTNLFAFDYLRDLVASDLPFATGIAIQDSRDSGANLIYTK
jgi:hypothetical protein